MSRKIDFVITSVKSVTLLVLLYDNESRFVGMAWRVPLKWCPELGEIGIDLNPFCLISICLYRLEYLTEH